MGTRKGFLEEIMLELRCEEWEGTDQAEKVKRERERRSGVSGSSLYHSLLSNRNLLSSFYTS